MGEIKNFAIWLAKCIYVEKLSERQIIEEAQALWGLGSAPEDIEWMQTQINQVVSDPRLYRELSKRNNT